MLYQFFFFLRCIYCDFLCFMIPDIHHELKNWIQLDIFQKILHPYKGKVYHTVVLCPEKMENLSYYILNSNINSLFKFIYYCLVNFLKIDLPVDNIIFLIKLNLYDLYDSYYELIIILYFCIIPFLGIKKVYISIFIYIKNMYIKVLVYEILNNRIHIYYLKKKKFLIQQQLEIVQYLAQNNITVCKIELFLKKRQNQIVNCNRYSLIMIAWWDELKIVCKKFVKLKR